MRLTCCQINANLILYHRSLALVIVFCVGVAVITTYTNS